MNDEMTMTEPSTTITNGSSPSTPKKRAPKGTLNVGVVDHIQVLQNATKALHDERVRLIKRVEMIDVALGDGQTLVTPGAARGTPIQGTVETIAVPKEKAPKKRKAFDQKPVRVAAPKAPKAPTERMARRSDESIAEQLSTIVTLLGDFPEGLRAEEIRTKLQLEAKAMPRLLKAGLYSKALTKTGEKRATVYSSR